MTAVAPKLISSRAYPVRRAAKGSRLVHMLRTTDPKDIAILYLVTSFAFFLIGGAMAVLIRGDLAVPGQQFLSNEQYNQRHCCVGRGRARAGWADVSSSCFGASA